MAVNQDVYCLYPISFKDMDCLFREVGPRFVDAGEEYTTIEIYQLIKPNQLKRLGRYGDLVDALESITIEEKSQEFINPVMNY